KHTISNALNKLHQYFDNNLDLTSSKQNATTIEQNKAGHLGITLTSVMGSLLKVITYIILILVYMVLMLFYRSHFKNFILKLVPETQITKTKKIIAQSAKVVQQYLLGLFMIIVM